MGLSISHDAFDGSYSHFKRFRDNIKKVIRPGYFIDNPIKYLLNHSDCDGEIEFEICKDLAEELTSILSSASNMKDCDEKEEFIYDLGNFIRGCNKAYSKKENLIFS